MTAWLLPVVAVLAVGLVVAQPEEPHSCAIVTMLYDTSVLPGALVQGRSLDLSGTDLPRYALVTNDALDTIPVLEEAGWHAIRIGEKRKNPNGKAHLYYQGRLHGAYSKLDIYKLSNVADRLIYLDTDTQIKENIEELCQCRGVCGTVRSSFVNTGVLVVEPNPALHAKMVADAPFVPSYNGGEQGFTNWFLAGFEKCSMFYPHDPCTGNATAVENGLVGVPRNCPPPTMVGPAGFEVECHRLPAYYNGDVGMHLLHKQRWNFPRDDQHLAQRTEPKILHHTLGIFKPWKWWSFLILDIGWEWRELFTQTILYSHGADLWVTGVAAMFPLFVWYSMAFHWPLLTSIVAPTSPRTASLQRSTRKFLSLCVPVCVQIWMWLSFPLSMSWMNVVVGHRPVQPYLGLAAWWITHSVMIDGLFLRGLVAQNVRPSFKPTIRRASPIATALFVLMLSFYPVVWTKVVIIVVFAVAYFGILTTALAWGTSLLPSHMLIASRQKRVDSTCSV